MSPRPRRVVGAFALSFLLLSISLAVRGQPQTAILTLKNGDRLSGGLIHEEQDRITITNALLGRITIPRSEIERLETIKPEPPPVVTVTNQPVLTLTGPQQKRLNELLDLYRSGTISPEEYHAQRSGLLAEAESTPGTNVVVVKSGVASPADASGQAPAGVATPASPPVKAKGPKRWSGDAQLGVDFVLSERDRQLFTGRLKLNYAHKRLRNAFDYSFAYGRTEGVLSANRMDGSMKTDYDVIKRFYVYNLGGAGYDEIRRIDMRFEEGPGAGWFILRGTNYVLRAEYGLNYQAQMNLDGTENEKIYHRYAEEFTWKPNAKFSFDEKFEFFPTWGEWRRYRFRFEANARYWLAANLSLVITVLDQYDTQPAGRVNQNDLQIRSSVGVKF